MKFVIIGKNIDVTPGLKASVEEKIGKLEKLGIAPKRSNAKIKTGSRLSGPESVIPKELSDGEITD